MEDMWCHQRADMVMETQVWLWVIGRETVCARAMAMISCTYQQQQVQPRAYVLPLEETILVYECVIKFFIYTNLLIFNIAISEYMHSRNKYPE